MTLDAVKPHFIARGKASTYTGNMKVTPIKAFGARLKAAMKDAGVSQADLARRYEITPQAIYGWTVSKLPPDLAIERWVSLSNLLNVNLDWLALGIGPRERVDMNQAIFDMLRQFQQLDGSQQHVIITMISTFLSQKDQPSFDVGKRP